MLEKKYMFETSHTRYKRYIANLCLAILSLGACYITFGCYLLYAGRNETQLTKNAFYQKSPDLVVVFTGDIGRIPTAIELAKKFEIKKIFITGVYTQNTVDHLLRVTGKLNDPNVDSRQIEIDYLARNTVENVLSTHRFLHQHQDFKKILLVSSDYHIYRIQRIINALIEQPNPVDFYYYGTSSDLKKFRSYRTLAKETYKVLKAMAFLMLWSGDRDDPLLEEATPVEK